MHHLLVVHECTLHLLARGQLRCVGECPDQFDWESLTENGARTLMLHVAPQKKMSGR